MTGLEILEGLSFVDPRYIAEAENARFQKGTSWMKWLSMAACLCIVTVGVFAYGQVMRQSTKDALTEMSAAPAAAPEMNDKAEAAGSEECAPEATEAPAGEQKPIASAVLRVTKLREDGFEAVVEEGTDLLEAGMQVRVVLADGVYGASQTDTESGTLNIGPDALLLAENGTYDPETNTLYVVEISPAE